MSLMRIFIAADIGAEQKSAAVQLIENLKKGVNFTKARPKWVNSDELHITIKFLGNVESDQVDRIIQNVGPVVLALEPFEFRLKGLGTFPNWRKPKVLWVGVRKDKGRMGAVQETVDRSMVSLGFAAERRTFHPHLTLARIRSLRGVEALMDVVESHRGAELDVATLAHVTLYQSHLSPKGPDYEVLHRWPLRGGARPGALVDASASEEL